MNYVFGVTSVRLPSFAMATALGMLPGTVLFVWFGSAAKALHELASGAPSGNGLGQIALVAFGVIASIAVLHIIHRIGREALRQTGHGDLA